MKGILVQKQGFSVLKIPFLVLIHPKMPLHKKLMIWIFGIDVSE